MSTLGTIVAIGMALGTTTAIAVIIARYIRGKPAGLTPQQTQDIAAKFDALREKNNNPPAFEIVKNMTPQEVLDALNKPPNGS